MRIPNFSLFTGTANPDQTTAIARSLDHRVSPCVVERFPDGELSVRLDEPARGRPVFIIQSTCPPVTEHLFELLALVDAAAPRPDASRPSCLTSVTPAPTNGTRVANRSRPAWSPLSFGRSG